MNNFELLKSILNSVLGIDLGSHSLGMDTKLLGHIPEFDSLAVVTVIDEIENQFDIIIEPVT